MKATIRDIASLSGVSTATVDRVLNRRAGVKPTNRHKVLQAAKHLRYLTEEDSLTMPARPARLEFFVPVGSNAFLAELCDQIVSICDQLPLVHDCLIHRLDNSKPEHLIEALDAVSLSTDGIGLVALDEPRVRAATTRLASAGVSVVTIVSDLPSATRANYVGIDNAVAGRTAGQMMGMMLNPDRPNVSLFVGSHKYRGHQEREVGFRDVLLERAPWAQLGVPVETQDDAKIGYAEAARLLQTDQSIGGIYVAGGGRSGVIEAIADYACATRPILFCHDLTEATRKALLDGLIDVVIDQNTRGLAEQSVIHLLGALAATDPFPVKKLIEPRIITRQNIPLV
ncbi:MAG: LacI family DNA-binding transcriptional regulator [Pseudomonadota bacterium]